jgi:hypothetical protein
MFLVHEDMNAKEKSCTGTGTRTSTRTGTIMSSRKQNPSRRSGIPDSVAVMRVRSLAVPVPRNHPASGHRQECPCYSLRRMRTFALQHSASKTRAGAQGSQAQQPPINRGGLRRNQPYLAQQQRCEYGALQSRRWLLQRGEPVVVLKSNTISVLATKPSLRASSSVYSGSFAKFSCFWRSVAIS